MVGSEPLPLAFTGSVREYFRIWVVNTFLTLVTFGVFSAWAKVRKKRYLYSHTLVDGTPLRYLGRPIPILKGRALAACLLLAWYLITNHYQVLMIPLALGALLGVPWLLLRTAAFNARSTSYRNITFDFKSNYKTGLGLLLGGGLLTIVTCGLAYPLLQFRLRHWLVTSTYYGEERCRFLGSSDGFYRIYLTVWAGTAVALGLLGFGVLNPLASIRSNLEYFQFLPLVPYAVYLVATCCVYTLLTNRVWTSTELGPVRFKSKLRVRDMLWLYGSNAVVSVCSLGLLAPWATLRMLRYRVSKLSLSLEGSLEDLRGAKATLPSASGAEAAEAFDLEIAL